MRISIYRNAIIDQNQIFKINFNLPNTKWKGDEEPTINNLYEILRILKKLFIVGNCAQIWHKNDNTSYTRFNFKLRQNDDIFYTLQFLVDGVQYLLRSSPCEVIIVSTSFIVVAFSVAFRDITVDPS